MHIYECMYSHPLATVEDWFQDPADIRLYKWSSPLYKMLRYQAHFIDEKKQNQATTGYAYTSFHLHGFSIVLGEWQIQVLLFETSWDFFFFWVFSTHSCLNLQMWKPWIWKDDCTSIYLYLSYLYKKVNNVCTISETLKPAQGVLN